MKKCFLPLLIGLFVTLGSASAFANEEELDLPIPKEIVSEKISDYLSSNSLYPYIKSGQGEIQITSILEPIVDNAQLAMIFLEGEFATEGKPLKGLFAVQLIKATNTSQAKLFCLSDSDLITPQLFFDIVNGPQLTLSSPEGMKLLQEKNGHIFISSDDSHNAAKRVQTWTLFTPEESYDVPVTLTDDGKGGTYFTISIPKNS
jgi:hypothetical protein